MEIKTEGGLRLKEAIALRETDVIPVAHNVDSFAARCGDITLQEWWFNRPKARGALEKTVEMIGGIDGFVNNQPPSHPLVFQLSAPMKLKLPGVELGSDDLWQFDEKELMRPEDYDTVIKKGFKTFLDSFRPKVGISPDSVPAIVKEITSNTRENIAKWREKGIEVIGAGTLRLPFDFFTYARAMEPFILDLRRRPEKVIEATDAALPEIISTSIAFIKEVGGIGAFIPGSRASNTFLSPGDYQKFCHPWLIKAAEALVAADIVPLLHFDSNWTQDLEFFKELPKAKCILELDGQTDIFKAKKVLGGHMCIMGDVDPALLIFGSKQDVIDYCKKLIDEVGQGGGLILNAGCCVPPEAKPENMLAITETARTHGAR